MEYVLLIYNSEERWNALDQAQEEQIMAAHYALMEKTKADGVYLGGERLTDTPMATTVRNHGGKITVTDGPFAETKEQLGGYYVLDCPDLDAAIEYAGMLPHGDLGSVEIRPVFQM